MHNSLYINFNYNSEIPNNVLSRRTNYIYVENLDPCINYNLQFQKNTCRIVSSFIFGLLTCTLSLNMKTFKTN